LNIQKEELAQAGRQHITSILKRQDAGGPATQTAPEPEYQQEVTEEPTQAKQA